MRHLSLCLVAIATLTIFSCKKDKDTLPPQKDPPGTDSVYADYMHLKPGNYWIYEQYQVDTDGTATATHIFDSIYAGPEIIHEGQSYHTRMVPDGSSGLGGYQTELFRDSLHYILGTGGAIFASYEDFSSVFRQQYLIMYGDSIALMSIRMTDRNKIITVPAGTFPTIVRGLIWTMCPGHTQYGAERREATCISKATGIISETISTYFGNNIQLERRLVRYHVE